MAKTNESKMTRRSFVRGAAALAALLPVSGVLAACGTEPDSAEPADGGSADAEAAPGQEPVEDTAADGASTQGATLVAYFSATGNTEAVARAIAEHTGADTFVIKPQQPYTAADLDYNDSASRTSQERSSGASVPLAQVTPDGFENYSTVYVGYPIWWGEAAWVLNEFVAGNDFADKVVVPFCTSASSGLGRSGELLAEMAGTGDWRGGTRFSAGVPTADVTAWVDGLGL